MFSRATDKGCNLTRPHHRVIYGIQFQQENAFRVRQFIARIAHTNIRQSQIYCYPKINVATVHGK